MGISSHHFQSFPTGRPTQRMQAAASLLQGKGLAVAPDIASDAYPSEVLFDILNSIPMPVFVFEPCGGERLPVYLNKEYLAMLGADTLQDAIDGCQGDFERYVSPDDRELVKSQDERIVANIGKTVSFEFHIVTMEGRKHLVRAYSCARHDTSGSLIVVSLFVSLADRLNAEDTPLDAVTGLVPMQSFFKIMQRWRSDFNAYRDGTELAVLYIDIVNFRLINSRGGISAGDRFLKKVAEKLRVIFPVNAISRFDADHFVVLAHEENMKTKARSVRDLFQEIAPSGVGINIGASVWTDHALAPEEICNQAKAACDESRRHLNTYFAVYDEKMGQHLETRGYVISHIGEAIEEGWIRAFYQPIIRATSGVLCGVEVLARWDDPVRGMLSPVDFIPSLEDSQQVWKLDLCVAEQAFSEIASHMQQGLAIIPVSINLSRTDFFCCDIFSEIEHLAAKHAIPRSAVHIEVTETAIVSQEDVVVKTLDRFREVGYEVWMDDFGSGYSSLNLLKDYDFDVLKLDMAFLRKDTKRSRTIISSVISMDKHIGIRTLAEGVETREQADFLRRAGCEKMQGYYFGKPLPFGEMLKQCSEKGFPVESMRQKAFFDAAASVDFLVNDALVLFDYWGGRFHVLQYNEHAETMMRWYGSDSAREFENAVNEWNSSSSSALAPAMQYAIETGEPGEQAIIFKGKGMLFRFRAVKSVEGHNLIVATYFDMPDHLKEAERISRALMSLLEFYRDVFYLDLGGKTIQSLRFGINISGSSDVGMIPILNSDGSLASLIPKIFEADRARYRRFLDPATLKERLEKAEDETLSDVFRTATSSGRYRWMEHTLLFEHGSNRNRAIYGIRPLEMHALATESDLVKTGSRQTPFEDPDQAGRTLWANLISNLPLKLFWKDAKRRFVGATKAFLDYYGFDSIADIAGKTDDELGWHPDESDYRDEERCVLESGKASRDVRGRCIRHGRSQSILASKWPIYRNGEIIGLMGYFVETDESGSAEAVKQDRLGIGSMRGIETFVEDLILNVIDFEENGRMFGFVRIAAEETPFEGQEGNSQDIDASVGEAILRTVGHRGSVVRFSACHYGVLAKSRSHSDFAVMAEEIRAAVEAISCKEGKVKAQIQLGFAEDLSLLVKRLCNALLEGTVVDASVHREEDRKRMELLEQLLDLAPFGCYILKPDQTVLFWNRDAERILGYPADEMVGRMSIGSTLKCLHANGDLISSDHYPEAYALVNGEPQTAKMFMQRKDGTEVLVRETVVPLADSGGKISWLIGLFVPLVDESYEHSLVRQIYQSATQDPVTGLPGRKYMEVAIADALEIYRRTGQVFAVLFADIDEFHDINNTYGHVAGDKVLKGFSDLLGQSKRRCDSFCRWGGDEFVGLLHLRSTQDIEGLVRRYMKSAEDFSVRIGDDDIGCAISAGIAAVREGDTMQSLIDRADQHMYEAKGRPHERIVTDSTSRRTGGKS